MTQLLHITTLGRVQRIRRKSFRLKEMGFVLGLPKKKLKIGNLFEDICCYKCSGPSILKLLPFFRSAISVKCRLLFMRKKNSQTHDHSKAKQPFNTSSFQ